MKTRTGDSGSETYYRSDRFYSEQGAWYAKTREGDELGPFDSKSEAKEGLEVFIEMNSDMLDADLDLTGDG